MKILKEIIKLNKIQGYIKFLRKIDKVFVSCDPQVSLNKFEKQPEVSHGAIHISMH